MAIHEYEFRLAVWDESSFDSLLQLIAHKIGVPITEQVILFAKPHFRFRQDVLESKRQISIEAIFHHGFWFRWVHSLEIPFKCWPKNLHDKFINTVANAQDPFRTQVRKLISIDDSTKVFSFIEDELHILVFEWEYGTFPNELEKINHVELLNSLSKYRSVYRKFRHYRPYPLRFNFDESMTRKPVSCLKKPPTEENYLVAHKWDGVFGLLYSFNDKIYEKWEGYKRYTRSDISLGDGLVFAAEKLQSKGNKLIVLLDVYQVRGNPTASWSRESILLDFLPRLKLPEGYIVQEYCRCIKDLSPPNYPTDGYVYHNIKNDVIHKIKPYFSIDVLYRDGYFVMDSIDKRFKCLEPLKLMRNSLVYEINVDDGRVIRRRDDRFTGNTEEQLKNIFKSCNNCWNGAKWENIPNVESDKKWKKKK